MDVKAILKLNIDFYHSAASDFDKTRQASWPGWERLGKHIRKLVKNTGELSVADIACGNGRFGVFLQKLIYADKLNYFGFDINEYLLSKAQMNVPEGKYIKIDLLKNGKCVNGSYDLIVVFGFMHHIPTQSLRLSLLKHLADRLKPGGVLALSFWQYQILSTRGKRIGRGDYLSLWNGTSNKRYVHIYSPTELQAIIKQLESRKLSVLDDYCADGRNGKLNRYFIFGKN